ncbi:hypothetical protein FOL47_006290 [Perkinsus chesapeaki]|uniref:Uncharacterized protein n=1 Tax=Perkinsus chesapeaki TaxID=330153 RepID=A0A7J6MY59_PERCH|nr:hypothetical protein FOL47_006290 [Perkinsus chesapeaki]
MDFLSDISIEDPSTLDDLYLDDTPTIPIPDTTVGISPNTGSTPQPGLFDHLTIESPFPWFSQPGGAAPEYPSTRFNLFDGVVLENLTTAAPGLFDGLYIEDPRSGDTSPIEDMALKNGFSEDVSTESLSTTHPTSVAYAPTPTVVRDPSGEIKPDLVAVSATRSHLGTSNDYSIILVVVVVILGLLQLVGLLQTWILQRSLRESTQVKCTKDLEQRYIRDKTADLETGCKEDIIAEDSTGNMGGK